MTSTHSHNTQRVIATDDCTATEHAERTIAYESLWNQMIRAEESLASAIEESATEETTRPWRRQHPPVEQEPLQPEVFVGSEEDLHTYTHGYNPWLYSRVYPWIYPWVYLHPWV